MPRKLRAINELEKLLKKTQNERSNFESFIRKFLVEEIIVPSSTEVINGKFEPLLFNKEGVYMMASFTSIALLDLYKNKVKQYLIITGKMMLEQLPYGVGVVVNPGYDIGFDISPNGIKQILRDFR